MALIPIADALRAALVPGGSQFSGNGTNSVISAANIQPLLARLQAEQASAAARGTATQPAHIRDLWERMTGTRTTDQALRSGNAFSLPPGYAVTQSIPSIGAQFIKGPTGDEYLFNQRTGELLPPQPTSSDGGVGYNDIANIGSAQPSIAGGGIDINALLAALASMNTGSSGFTGGGALSLTRAPGTGATGPNLSMTSAISPDDPVLRSSTVRGIYQDGTYALQLPDGRQFIYDPTAGTISPDTTSVAQATTGLPGIVSLASARQLLTQQLTAELTKQQGAGTGVAPQSGQVATGQPAQAGGTTPAQQAQAIAENVDDDTLQRLLSFGGSGVNLAKFFLGGSEEAAPDVPLSEGQPTQFTTDPGSAVFPSILAALQAASSIASDQPDWEKAARVGVAGANFLTNPSVMESLGLAGSVAGPLLGAAASYVPYAGAALSAFDIARIAQGDLPDDAKAAMAAITAAQAVLTFTGWGTAALPFTIILSNIVEDLVSAPGTYDLRRAADGDALRAGVPRIAGEIPFATTMEELNGLFGERWGVGAAGGIASDVRAELGPGGTVKVVGHHFPTDLTELGQVLTQLYQRQASLIQAGAQGNPQARQFLQGITAANTKFKGNVGKVLPFLADSFKVPATSLASDIQVRDLASGSDREKKLANLLTDAIGIGQGQIDTSGGEGGASSIFSPGKDLAARQLLEQLAPGLDSRPRTTDAATYAEAWWPNYGAWSDMPPSLQQDAIQAVSQSGGGVLPEPASLPRRTPTGAGFTTNPDEYARQWWGEAFNSGDWRSDQYAGLRASAEAEASKPGGGKLPSIVDMMNRAPEPYGASPTILAGGVLPTEWVINDEGGGGFWKTTPPLPTIATPYPNVNTPGVTPTGGKTQEQIDREWEVANFSYP